MSGHSAHQLLGRMDSDTFALALQRAEALRSGALHDATDREMPLLRYLAAVQKHLDVVRSQTAADTPGSRLTLNGEMT